MRALIVGVTGYLGSNISRRLKQEPSLDVYGVSRKDSACPMKFFIDLLSDEKLWPHIGSFDVIIYCAGTHSIQDAESDQSQSYELNYNALKKIYGKYANTNTKLILLSTQRVFSGNEPFCTEECVPDPTTNYGMHRVQAENFTLRNNGVVLRCTKVLSSLDERLATIHERLLSDQEVCVSTNVSASFVSIDDYVKAVLLLIRGHMSGIYHLSGSDQSSWYSIARLIAKQMNIPLDRIKIQNDSKQIINISSMHVTLRTSDCFTRNLLGNDTVSSLIRSWVDRKNMVKATSR